MEKINMSLTFKVEGKEVCENTFSFTGTDMETVLIWENALLEMVQNLVKKQQKGEI